TDPVVTDFQFRLADAVIEMAWHNTDCAEEYQEDLRQMAGGRRTIRGVQQALDALEARGHLRIVLGTCAPPESEKSRHKGERHNGLKNCYIPVIFTEGGTNARSYPPVQQFVPPTKPRSHPPTNPRSDGVRTAVRTEEHLSSSEETSL